MSGIRGTSRLNLNTSKFTLCQRYLYLKSWGIDRLYPYATRAGSAAVHYVPGHGSRLQWHFNYRPEKGSLQSNLLCTPRKLRDCKEDVAPLPLCRRYHVAGWRHKWRRAKNYSLMMSPTVPCVRCGLCAIDQQAGRQGESRQTVNWVQIMPQTQVW